MNPVSSLHGRSVGQIGIIVPDLGHALARYSSIWGIGAWNCYRYGPDTVPRLTYRGRPGTYSMLVALNTESPQLELIQPLQGPSIYEEWLESHDEGLHHVAVFVESFESETEAMVAAGYELLQSGYGYGRDGDGGYAYFDTARELGIIVELIERPRRRRQPDFTWPSGA